MRRKTDGRLQRRFDELQKRFDGMPAPMLKNIIVMVKGTCYLLVFFAALFVNTAWRHRESASLALLSVLLAAGALTHLWLQIRTLKQANRVYEEKTGKPQNP